MTGMKKLKFVVVASILATMAMMIFTQPVGAKQRRQRQKQRQQRQRQRQPQRQPSWQPETRGQTDSTRFGSGNNGWRRGLWTRMSDEEKNQIYNYIETNFAKMFTELERLRNASPKRFENRMNRVAVEMQRLMELVENHPRRGALHIQERKFELELRFNIAKYRRSRTAKEKRQLTTTMEKLIGQIFDTQTKRQELEVQELEDRLVELTQRVKKRQSHRQEFVKKHLERIRNGPGEPEGPPRKDWLGEPGRP